MLNVLIYYCNLIILILTLRRNENIVKRSHLIVITFISIYLADLWSGIVHYVLDNYEGDCKKLKEGSIEFQIHHDNPLLILNDSLLHFHMETLELYFIPLGMNIANLVLKNTSRKKGLCYGELVFCVIASLSQCSHKLTHWSNHEKEQSRKLRFVRWMQKRKLITDSKEHSAHHRTHDNNFCILNGWANPLMNKLAGFGR